MGPTAQTAWRPVPGLYIPNAIGLNFNPVQALAYPITIWKGVGKHGSRNQQG